MRYTLLMRKVLMILIHCCCWEGVGTRTIQSLALVSEVIHGTPTRFSDPAHFSFAQGGKDGHPFPEPLLFYDETIKLMQESIENA